MAREQSTALDELWDHASKSRAWPSLASDGAQLRPSAVSQPAPSSTILSASHFVAGVVGQFRHQLQDHRLNKDRAAGPGRWDYWAAARRLEHDIKHLVHIVPTVTPGSAAS
jgi:hypothetical protein